MKSTNDQIKELEKQKEILERQAKEARVKQ